VGSPEELMAQSVAGDHTRTEGFPVPGHLLVFGGIIAHADPTSHLDQIKGFTPVEGFVGSGASTPGLVDSPKPGIP
jgi:hypothetical protein